MYTDTEKKIGNGDVHDGDELETESTSDMAIDDDQIYSHREQKAIIHRVDRRLVVMCGFLYCFSLIDRASDDVGKRFSVFYIIGCIANAFGGILAYGLMQMDGLGGKAGWRWIFIMEGLVSSFYALEPMT
ncbi:MAG: hypothetical protein Q9202_003623 [Teloschistes flavicans]